MQDNPEGELDPAVDDRWRCKKNSSVLSFIDNGTVHSGRGGGPALLKRPRESGRKDFSPGGVAGLS